MRSAEEIGIREKLYVTLRNAGFRINRVFVPLLSKIGSAYSVMKVYGPGGFGVIKAYAVGGEAYVYNVRIEGRRAAGMAAWLARLIESGYVRVEKRRRLRRFGRRTPCSTVRESVISSLRLQRSS